MNLIKLSPRYYDPLDKFLSSKTTADINRETYLICNLDDTINKIKVSIVFLKRCENIECGSFESCVIENQGAVFTVPCYWLDIPKELAFTYLTSIIDTFYEEHVAGWLNGTWAGNGNTTGSDSNNNITNNICPCPCN